MKLTFVVDDQKYDFNPRKLSNLEAIALQKSARISYTDFAERIGQMDAEALTAMVWLLQRRTDQSVKFSETEFDIIALVESVEMFDDDDNRIEPTIEDGEAVGFHVVNPSGEVIRRLDLSGNIVEDPQDGPGNEPGPEPETTSNGESPN